MSSEGIRSAIDNAIGYLGEHPGEARYTDSVAVAALQDGLRCTVAGPGGEKVQTDMPPSVGGGGSAPSAGWLFRAALASCTATLIAMRAAQLGVELSGLEVTVDSQSDDRGILGIDDRVPAGPLTIRLHVRLASTGAEHSRLQELADWGVGHCPVSDATQRAVPLTVEVEVG
jgi:uncharacterized OsmC-like protein